MIQQISKWFRQAKEDFDTANVNLNNKKYYAAVQFCQQCLEKCFKAIIEENDIPPIKSHDLLRLQLHANIQLSDSETILLRILNEVYIDSRYPGDLGLLPHGKPTIPETEAFIHLCDTIFNRLQE